MTLPDSTDQMSDQCRMVSQLASWVESGSGTEICHR